MGENHPGGYREHQRQAIGKRDPEDRADDYEEIWAPEWDPEVLQQQGMRCMDCGVPTCMGGCPIGNIIPDWNDLVHRDDWKQALEELHATNNFPEFTGYTCPAPCEDACTLNFNDDPVAIKSIERALVDKGWEEGWIEAEPPATRTEYGVAIVGSGPAGLAAAQQLNRVGHNVTVFERDDEIGGLMTYGIPDFKFSKKSVVRRVNQLKQEGIEFRTGVEVGEEEPLPDLVNNYDATCVAVGAQKHRDLSLPGRDLEGIQFAMDFLRDENRRQGDKQDSLSLDAGGKNVVVLGGGDTGADCVATAHRQGAQQVVQISINPKPPESIGLANDPWPELPHTYHKTYAQKEDGKEEFSVNTNEFLDLNGDGHVDHLGAERVLWTYDEEGSRVDKQVIQSDMEIPADLVLIAIGFVGPETNPFDGLDLEYNRDGTFETDETMMTNVDGLFAAGDANRGQSLVVWAIGEGRDAACHIDRYLTGSTNLPWSLNTTNPPLNT
jgi:glutamate synthase (NADPH/NADH) small chain